jgi:ribonuclease HIII
MEKLSKKYKREIPFGASKKVTEFAQEFANDFSREELLKIVKKNFANLDEVI